MINRLNVPNKITVVAIFNIQDNEELLSAFKSYFEAIQDISDNHIKKVIYKKSTAFFYYITPRDDNTKLIMLLEKFSKGYQCIFADTYHMYQELCKNNIHKNIKGIEEEILTMREFYRLQGFF